MKNPLLKFLACLLLLWIGCRPTSGPTVNRGRNNAVTWVPEERLNAKHAEFHRGDISETVEFFVAIAAELHRDHSKIIAVDDHPTLRLLRQLTVKWDLGVAWEESDCGPVPNLLERQEIALEHYGTLVIRRAARARLGKPDVSADPTAPLPDVLAVDAQILKIEIDRVPNSNQVMIEIELANAIPDPRSGGE